MYVRVCCRSGVHEQVALTSLKNLLEVYYPRPHSPYWIRICILISSPRWFMCSLMFKIHCFQLFCTPLSFVIYRQLTLLLVLIAFAVCCIFLSARKYCPFFFMCLAQNKNGIYFIRQLSFKVLLPTWVRSCCIDCGILEQTKLLIWLHLANGNIFKSVILWNMVPSVMELLSFS